MKIEGAVGLIGAGNMAEALIRGLIAAQVTEAARILASEPEYRRENCDVATGNDRRRLSVPAFMKRACM